MTEHTKGPWRAGRCDMVTLAGVDDDGEFAKNVYCDDARGGRDGAGKALPFVVARAYGDEVECIANALLIAAAPEMLTALRALLDLTEEQARLAEGRAVNAREDDDCDDSTVATLERIAREWRGPSQRARVVIAKASGGAR